MRQAIVLDLFASIAAGAVWVLRPSFQDRLGRHLVLSKITGAVIIALGDQNTGIMGNDQGLVDEIIACGKETGEGFWQLPLSAEYSKQIKSDIADIKNIGPRGKAGTIMGAVFIQEFIDKAKWAHLDIAGTAWLDSNKPHTSKGPTGVAIRTLISLVESRSKIETLTQFGSPNSKHTTKKALPSRTNLFIC
ncbi:MAG: hypothetical protein IPK01_11465 [Acidobacteria bacterium]|nr:hypothetical protein [Acidobacteriota bacterium]